MHFRFPSRARILRESASREQVNEFSTLWTRDLFDPEVVERRTLAPVRQRAIERSNSFPTVTELLKRILQGVSVHWAESHARFRRPPG